MNCYLGIINHMSNNKSIARKACYGIVVSRRDRLQTWDSTLALSIIVLESATRPLMAQPMWVSTSMIFSMDEGSINGDVIRFSTANTMPSEVFRPIAVDPSCNGEEWVYKGKYRGLLDKGNCLKGVRGLKWSGYKKIVTQNQMQCI